MVVTHTHAKRSRPKVSWFEGLPPVLTRSVNMVSILQKTVIIYPGGPRQNSEGHKTVVVVVRCQDLNIVHRIRKAL